MYVEDLAEGVVAALRPEAADRIYNLAGDEAVTVLEIAEAVRSGVRDTGIVHTPARSADFDGKHVSSERAARELGWTAKTPFADGFRRYLAWWRVRNHPRRVLILSADIGEGHELPARALATQLRTESPGVEVRVVDGLRAMGRLMALVIRDGSWLSFNWLPWLFEAQYFLLARFPPTRWLALKIGYLLCGRGLRKAIRADDPDVVVSTYPGTTAVLGELRRLGRLRGPGRLRDHRPSRPSLLGPPGRRPAHHHAPRVHRGGGANRGPRERTLGATPNVDGVPRPAIQDRGAPPTRTA